MSERSAILYSLLVMAVAAVTAYDYYRIDVLQDKLEHLEMLHRKGK